MKRDIMFKGVKISVDELMAWYEPVVKGPKSIWEGESSEELTVVEFRRGIGMWVETVPGWDHVKWDIARWILDQLMKRLSGRVMIAPPVYIMAPCSVGVRLELADV